MMWGNYGWMGWGWVFGALLVIGLLLVIFGLVLFMAVRLASPPRPGAGAEAPPPPPRDGQRSAKRILEERYAKGELTTEEYRERLGVLGIGP